MNYDTTKEVWKKLQSVYKGDSNVQQAKLYAYRERFEVLKMMEDENITTYFQWVREVVNIMKGIGE